MRREFQNHERRRFRQHRFQRSYKLPDLSRAAAIGFPGEQQSFGSCLKHAHTAPQFTILRVLERRPLGGRERHSHPTSQFVSDPMHRIEAALSRANFQEFDASGQQVTQPVLNLRAIHVGVQPHVELFDIRLDTRGECAREGESNTRVEAFGKGDGKFGPSERPFQGAHKIEVG